METSEPIPDRGPRIRLDRFLKLCGITATGGQAKLRIQGGEVKVNGAVETRRGHDLRPGDVVEVDGRSWPVEAERLRGPATPPASPPSSRPPREEP